MTESDENDAQGWISYCEAEELVERNFTESSSNAMLFLETNIRLFILANEGALPFNMFTSDQKM